MGRNSWTRQLGQDQIPVADNAAQTAGLNTLYQFCGPKGPLSCGTPDVNTLGVQNEEPRVEPWKGLAQSVETHLVIGRDQNRGLIMGRAQCIKTRFYGVAHSSNPPTDLDASQPIGPGGGG